MHCHTTCGQGALNLMQCTDTVPGGQWAMELLQCMATLPGAVGAGNALMHRHTTTGQPAVKMLQCTATLRGVNGQWNCCIALPDCLGAVGTGTAVMHHHTARRQRAAKMVQCTTTHVPAVPSIEHWKRDQYCPVTGGNFRKSVPTCMRYASVRRLEVFENPSKDARKFWQPDRPPKTQPILVGMFHGLPSRPCHGSSEEIF